MNDEIRALQAAMERDGYVADPAIATAAYLAREMRKPLLLEGEAGVGKTEVAKTLARMLDWRLIRLQCYEGLDSIRRSTNGTTRVRCSACGLRNGRRTIRTRSRTWLSTGRPSSARRLLISCSARISIVQRVHSSAARAVRSASKVNGCGLSTGMPIAEERVAVADALVGLALDPQHCLAAPDVVEHEEHPVDLETVTRIDQRLCVGRVTLRIRTAGEPPAVVAPLGRAQRRVREDVLVRDALAAAERLEDRAPGKLVGPVAEHRPVSDLARGRSTGADGVQQAARAGAGEPVEVRRPRRLVRGAPLEDVVRAVGEAVEEDDDDRVHAWREASGWCGW